MTDPIEQARHSALIGASNAVVLGILAGDAYEPMIAYEHAILRYHPNVVRLVEAARDYHMWHDRDINDWNATHEKAWSEVHYRRDVLEPLVAALVPFTTEEESE